MAHFWNFGGWLYSSIPSKKATFHRWRILCRLNLLQAPSDGRSSLTPLPILDKKLLLLAVDRLTRINLPGSWFPQAMPPILSHATRYFLDQCEHTQLGDGHKATKSINRCTGEHWATQPYFLIEAFFNQSIVSIGMIPVWIMVAFILLCVIIRCKNTKCCFQNHFIILAVSDNFQVAQAKNKASSRPYRLAIHRECSSGISLFWIIWRIIACSDAFIWSNVI